MSKAAGCLKNTQPWKKKKKSNLLFFIATFFSNNTDLLPTVHTALHQGSGRLEGEMGKTGGVHGVPKQQVASVSSAPQLINLVRERGGNLSHPVWPHWLARPLYSDQWGQRSDLVVHESWLSGMSLPQFWISRKRRRSGLPSTSPKSYIWLQNILFPSSILLLLK